MTSSFIKVTVPLLPNIVSSLFQESKVNKNKYNNGDKTIIAKTSRIIRERTIKTKINIIEQ